jgi:hypothetical protein
MAFPFPHPLRSSCRCSPIAAASVSLRLLLYSAERAASFVATLRSLRRVHHVVAWAGGGNAMRGRQLCSSRSEGAWRGCFSVRARCSGTRPAGPAGWVNLVLRRSGNVKTSGGVCFSQKHTYVEGIGSVLLKSYCCVMCADYSNRSQVSSQSLSSRFAHLARISRNTPHAQHRATGQR